MMQTVSAQLCLQGYWMIHPCNDLHFLQGTEGEVKKINKNKLADKP